MKPLRHPDKKPAPKIGDRNDASPGANVFDQQKPVYLSNYYKGSELEDGDKKRQTQQFIKYAAIAIGIYLLLKATKIV